MKKILTPKKIIIGLATIGLVAASATGVTLFLKDDGEASAAEQQGNVTEINQNNLPVTGNEIENNDPNGNTVDPNGNVVDLNGNTTDGGNSTSGTTGTISREEVLERVEETTITEERKVLENLNISWTTISIPTIANNMSVFKPQLTIEKNAVEVNDNEITDNTTVRSGDIVKYEIKVANIGNYKATNVIIKESLDVTLDSDKIKAGSELLKINTLEPGKQARFYVEYEVTDQDVENLRKIENVIYATDGKTTVSDNDETVSINPNTEVSGKKTWIDNNNKYNTRPDSITINLLADGNKVDEQIVKPNEDGTWTYEFKKIPTYNSEKNIIVYSVEESSLELYTYTTIDGSYDIVNTIKQTTTTVSGSKTWVTPEDVSKLTATVELYRDNEKINETTVTGNNTYKFENLDKYDLTDGHEYVYTVKETNFPGYVASYRGNDITNTKQISAKKSAVTSTGVEEVNIGETITYTISITNNTAEATKVKVKDNISELNSGSIKVELKGNITLDGTALSYIEVQNLFKGQYEVDMPAYTTRKIEITIEIKEANLGDKISNTAYIDEDATNTVTNPIERTVLVTKYKNNISSTNIVLLLDASSSMNNTVTKKITRLDVAKEAIENFIEETYKIEENKNVTFTLLTFANRAYTEGNLSTNNKQFHGGTFNFNTNGQYDHANGQYIINIENKDAFLTAFRTLKADSGTNMRAGLEVAENTIKEIKSIEQYKEYDTVLIFFGDGEPYGETNLLNNAAGIKAKAQDIKNMEVKVYSIGFGKDAAIQGTEGYERLKDISGDGKVYTSTNYTELIKNFSEIVGADPEYSVLTIDGKATIKVKESDDKKIIVDAEKNPIILTIGTSEVTITNAIEAAACGLTYSENEIVWDVSNYLKNINLKISYHVK